MHVKNDDEIYDVDQTYLGPPGRYIARMKYKTIVLYPAVAIPAFIVLRQFGMPLTVLTIGLFIAVSLRVAMTLSNRITRERPFTSAVAALLHDVHAPKKIDRYRVGAPSQRRCRRIGKGCTTAGPIQHRVPRPQRRIRARDLDAKAAAKAA